MINENNNYLSHSWPALAAAWILGLTTLLFSVMASANLFDEDEPLAPELAFKAGIEGIEGSSIIVSFDIVDGYYLYRDKLAFSLQTEAEAGQSQSTVDTLLAVDNATTASLGAPAYPPAQTMEDDFFGVQAVFRGPTQISVPFESLNPHASVLFVKFQGCADIGLCYPPTTVELPVQLPATQAEGSQIAPANQISSSLLSSQTPAAGASAPSLSDTLNFSADEELLPPEVAYLPQIDSATSGQISFSWFIEDGYYLYRDKLSFELTKPDSLTVEEISVSEGVEEYDEFFGDVSVLRHSAQALISLTETGSSNSIQHNGGAGELTVYYQGCADIGVCFPPSKVSLPVSFSGEEVALAMVSNDLSVLTKTSVAVSDMPDSGKAAYIGNTAELASNDTDAPPVQSEHDRLSGFLSVSNVWLTVATFFGLGLLLAFTPCVLPMVPILSSLIVGRGQNISGVRAFQLSAVYVLVMASTYAVVGIFVGLSGYNIQAFFQSPAVLTAIALLFVALSLSMFGFYELQAPAALQNKLTQLSNRQGGGQFGGVAAMGFISTLVVGPCVTAPLAGALLYIANTGDAFVGGAALFALGLGMGAPLLLIGTSAGKLLPRSGAWMNSIKYIFGILLLGMAVYMLSRFLPATVSMALYGFVALISGVYLGAFNSMTPQSLNWHRFGKAVGLAATVYGVALFVGALSGTDSYIRPLGTLAGKSNSNTESPSEHSLPFQPVKSIEDLEAAVARASAVGKPVMLDFYADWCVSCKEMDAKTFSDKRVQTLLSDAVVVQADVTLNDALDQALLKHFNLFGPPGIIFYDHGGTELPAAQVVGFMNADNFTAHIQRFLDLPDAKQALVTASEKGSR